MRTDTNRAYRSSDGRNGNSNSRVKQDTSRSLLSDDHLVRFFLNEHLETSLSNLGNYPVRHLVQLNAHPEGYPDREKTISVF